MLVDDENKKINKLVKEICCQNKKYNIFDCKKIFGSHVYYLMCMELLLDEKLDGIGLGYFIQLDKDELSSKYPSKYYNLDKIYATCSTFHHYKIKDLLPDNSKFKNNKSNNENFSNIFVVFY